MATRKDIIEQLKQDFEDNVKSANNYNSDPATIVIGVLDPQEFVQLPGVGFWIIEDVVDDDIMDNDILRTLNMIAYCYVDSDGYNVYDDLYNLIGDIEKFLYSSDFTYSSKTLLGNVLVSYGGTNEQVGTAVLNFSITYEQTGLTS